jgi:D-alanyl-D-alanine carboxypeptidase
MSASWADQARSNLDQALARLFAGEGISAGPGVMNAVLRVEAPDLGFVHAAAVGKANADLDAPMTPDHQFHLASVAKTMTAALLLQLWEEGALGPSGLDTTLAELALFDDEIVERLHMIDGVSYGKQITVRHLLTHTSGIKDAVVDDATGTAHDYGAPAPGSYGARLRKAIPAHLACLADPACDISTLVTSKKWTMWDPTRPQEKEAGVINWFLAIGTAAASLSPPGEAFHYSDTGYVILGLLSEKLSGKSLHRQWRERIFDPLGMDKSYLAYARDPEPAPWIGEVSDFYLENVPYVTSRINVSFDRGGGGVVSTAADVVRFLRALIDGQLFQNPQTLAAMLQWRAYPGISPPRAGVGLGIFAERSGQGRVALGHSGAYGAKMYFEPESGIYFCGTVNQRTGVPYYWWKEMFEAIHKARP